MALVEDIPDTEEAPDPQAFVQSVTASENLVPDLDETRLIEIGQQVADDYETDKDSMSDWLDMMRRGIDLARLVKKDKDYPFKGAANIKYPLIASAALQFNARAYPAIVQPDRMVKVKTYGSDRDGRKADRAERVSAHMSWDVACNIPSWEEGIDTLLVQLPIVGDMFRKVWFDPALGKKQARLIEPGRFIVNDKVRSLDSAPRCSEEIDLFPHEIEERVRTGQFVDPELPESPDDKHEAETFIEQHTRIDLDDDGYPEPYIVTIHEETNKVVRLVADFSEEDVQFETEQQMTMQPMQGADPYTGNPMVMMQPVPVEIPVGIKTIKRGSYFIHYQFMPGMGGGFWGTGFGVLLGDISEVVNSTFNMLLDAGHYASLGGGFIGSDFKIKGGSQRMRPGEWKLTQAQGSTIRDSVVPMTFPGPDAVLFQMLGMLVEAAKELSSTKDIMTGDSQGRTQTATTTLALIEQGMTLFTAVYKRVFRGLKHEFGLMARINRDTVTPEEYNAFHDEEEMHDPRADYSAADMDIVPVADPNAVTKMQEMAKAQLLNEMAGTGQIDPVEAGQRVLEAASIDRREELMPKPNPAEEQMMQLQMADAEAGVRLRLIEIEEKMAEIEKTRSETMNNLGEMESRDFQDRLDAAKMLLEDERGRLQLVIGRSPDRVASGSSGGSGVRGSSQGNGGGGRSLSASMVGGSGNTGSAAFGDSGVPVQT